jgi:hypothetical protein
MKAAEGLLLDYKRSLVAKKRVFVIAFLKKHVSNVLLRRSHHLSPQNILRESHSKIACSEKLENDMYHA